MFLGAIYFHRMLKSKLKDNLSLNKKHYDDLLIRRFPKKRLQLNKKTPVVVFGAGIVGKDMLTTLKVINIPVSALIKPAAEI